MNEFKQHITLGQLRDLNSDIIAQKLIKTGLIKHDNREMIHAKKFASKIDLGVINHIVSSITDKFAIENDKMDGENWYIVEFTFNGGRFEKRENGCLIDVLWEIIKLVLNESEVTYV